MFIKSMENIKSLYTIKQCWVRETVGLCQINERSLTNQDLTRHLLKKKKVNYTQKEPTCVQVTPALPRGTSHKHKSFPVTLGLLCSANLEQSKKISLLLGVPNGNLLIVSPAFWLASWWTIPILLGVTQEVGWKASIFQVLLQKSNWTRPSCNTFLSNVLLVTHN